MAKRLFTSESVTEGHPDKVCDQISDAVLDDILAHDPNAHVACETFTTTGIVTVMGEITTKHYTDIPSIVRRTVERIGYTDPAYGFDYRSCAVMTAIDEQSPDIAMGVNESFELQEGGTDEADRIGAGDQGMMFGYACDETDVLMPAPIDLAHKLARQLTDVRKSGKLSWLRPDGKSQVTVEYGDDGKVLSCPAIVVSTQHDPDIALKDLREAVVEEIIKPIIPAHYITKDTKFYVNPTGRFVVGGPVGDTGLTGRKIIVDTYGGSAAHGGGCFSGKDPTKVDRSAAWPSGARFSWPTPSVWPTPSPSWWTPTVPACWTRRSSPPSSTSASTCARPRSSSTWISAAPSTSRLPPMATSAAPTWICPGSTPTWWRSSRAICKRRPSLYIIYTPAADSACGGRFLCNSRAAWRRAAASFHGAPCAHEVLYR